MSASSVEDVHAEEGETAYAPMKVGADLVRLARTDSVALSATGLEETSTLGSVTYTNA